MGSGLKSRGESIRAAGDRYGGDSRMVMPEKGCIIGMAEAVLKSLLGEQVANWTFYIFPSRITRNDSANLACNAGLVVQTNGMCIQ